MYIPSASTPPSPSRVPGPQAPITSSTVDHHYLAHAQCPPSLLSLCRWLFGSTIDTRAVGDYPETVQKRQFSDDGSENTNIKIGIVVGILLAAFLAVVGTFWFFYGRSTRFTDRKRRHRRHKSTSSKSSRSSDGPPPSRAPPPNDAPPPPDDG